MDFNAFLDKINQYGFRFVYEKGNKTAYYYCGQCDHLFAYTKNGLLVVRKIKHQHLPSCSDDLICVLSGTFNDMANGIKYY